MRLVFFGTPDFAAVSLSALIEKHTVAAVFCQPDKPVGRGMKLTAPPVKVLAERHNIPVYQPASLLNGGAAQTVRELGADISAVIAYGRIMPTELINAARLGAINVHGSLLPKWRGAAPIQRAIMAGDTVSGVCVQQMEERLDAGDVLLSRETPIGARETYGELYAKLAAMGAELLLDALERFNSLTPQPQNEAYATYASPITKAECDIDTTKTATELVNHIRGLSPKPGAFAVLNGVRVKVFAAHAADASDVSPLFVQCDDGTRLVIDELQSPAGKRMTADAYLRGRRNS